MKLKKRKAAFSRKKAYYQRKKKKNPKIFSPELRKPKRKISFIESRVYILIGVALVFGIIYLLFFSTVFKIKKVIVNDLSFLDRQVVEDQILESFSGKRGLIFPKDNVFVFSSEKTKTSLIETNPIISKVVFKKEFPDILRAAVQEREIAAFWEQNESDYYYLALDGTVVSKASPEEMINADLPIIKNDFQKEIVIGEEITVPKIVTFIRNLEDEFESKTGLKPVHYLLPTPQASEVHVMTKNGFKVYFSLDREIDGQLDNLKLILTKEVKEKVNEIEYIDLRVDNWVYFK